MRRHVWLLLALGTLFAVGCENKNQQADAHLEEPYVPEQRTTLDGMDATPGPESAGTVEPLADEPFELAQATSSAPPAEPVEDEVLAPVGGQVYTVQKGDTLYALARRFYSDQARWRDIWEANKTRLPDPDQLQIGMKLIIP